MQQAPTASSGTARTQEKVDRKLLDNLESNIMDNLILKYIEKSLLSCSFIFINHIIA